MNEENKKLLLEAGVDLDRTMERFMNNEGLYLKFLKRFPEDPNFAQMKENIAGGQYEEAFKNAHTLKVFPETWDWSLSTRRFLY